MRAVHPAFHVSMLELATPNPILNHIQSAPPPVEIDGDPEYEISKILHSKVDKHHRHCNVLYLVRWAGYEGTYKETSWDLASVIRSAKSSGKGTTETLRGVYSLTETIGNGKTMLTFRSPETLRRPLASETVSDWII